MTKKLNLTDEERENWKAFFRGLGFVTPDPNEFKKFSLLQDSPTIATDRTEITKKVND